MNTALKIWAKLSIAVPIFYFYNTCYFLKDRAFSCCIVEYFDVCCDEVFCHLKSFQQELVRCSLSCYVQSLPQSVLKVKSLSRFTLSYGSCFYVNTKFVLKFIWVNPAQAPILFAKCNVFLHKKPGAEGNAHISVIMCTHIPPPPPPPLWKFQDLSQEIYSGSQYIWPPSPAAIHVIRPQFLGTRHIFTFDLPFLSGLLDLGAAFLLR